MTVTINNLTWTVKSVPNTHRRLTDENGVQTAYGITCFRELEIYLDKGMARELFEQTVVHELVHAVAFSYGIDINLENEEVICNFVGAHFDEIKRLRKKILTRL